MSLTDVKVRATELSGITELPGPESLLGAAVNERKNELYFPAGISPGKRRNNPTGKEVPDEYAIASFHSLHYHS